MPTCWVGFNADRRGRFWIFRYVFGRVGGGGVRKPLSAPFCGFPRISKKPFCAPRKTWKKGGHWSPDDSPFSALAVRDSFLWFYGFSTQRTMLDWETSPNCFLDNLRSALGTARDCSEQRYLIACAPC